jgi:outer membrane protein OmpA-like peptidoglycan-associated protein
MNRRSVLASISLAILQLVSSLFAQQDVKGGKDHPMFPTRMPGFYLSKYKEFDFDTHKFRMKPSPVSVEGHKYEISYRTKSGEKRPSALEVMRNYTNAFTAVGGKVLYNDGKSATMKLEKNRAEVWVEVWAANNPSGCHYYTLTIVEKGEMKQVITANAMLDALNKDGFIALDIHFDTGKSTIKPESRPIIEEIVALMKGNAALKLSVEGHTDNVGDAASNMKLSEERAQSVVATIVGQDIGASRLSAAGFGQDKPVADNRTEEGRAKNRRVELVKK